jgi:hypothetical protein
MYANMLTEFGQGGQITWHRRNIFCAINQHPQRDPDEILQC